MGSNDAYYCVQGLLLPPAPVKQEGHASLVGPGNCVPGSLLTDGGPVFPHSLGAGVGAQGCRERCCLKATDKVTILLMCQTGVLLIVQMHANQEDTWTISVSG